MDTKEIVNSIERGELNDAKDQIMQTLNQKAAEVVDMKRVEKSVNWMNDNTSEGEVQK